MGEVQVTAGQRITAAVLNNLPVTVSPLATGSVASSAAETVVGSFTIPAGDPVATFGYRLVCMGTADDTGTPTLTIRARLTSAGGTLLAGYGALTCRSGITGMPWSVKSEIFFPVTGAGGSFDWDGCLYQQLSVSPGTVLTTASYGNAADTTAPVLIVITAQWGASSASNICRTLDGGLGRI